MSEEPEKRARLWPWLWVAIAIVLLYPVSSGPMTWLAVEFGLGRWAYVIFEPVSRIAECNDTLESAYAWWMSQWSHPIRL